MRRRGVLIGVWVLCTAAATLIAWGAVNQVTQEVSPQAVLPLPATAAIVDVSPAAPASEDAERNDNPETQAEPAPESVTQAYDLVGGVVTVRYTGASTKLVQASPESGFVSEVNDQGPGKVDVRFRSDGHESRLVTRIRNGQPDPDMEERPR